MTIEHMKLTAHSEVGKIDSVFIKRAEDAFRDDEKLSREWETLNFLAKPDFEKAKDEYRKFEEVLQGRGIILRYFEANESVSIDAMYCRDASIVTDAGVIICNMGKATRSGEPGAQQRAYEQCGLKILGIIQPPGTIEGGDVAWLDTTTLAVGYTYRTNAEGIKQLKDLLTPIGVSVVVVSLPHYRGPADVFHLMSILSPVDKDLAVVYSALMPIAFRNELLDRGYRFIEVPDNEFDSMGCNVLALAPRQCLMVEGNIKTMLALEEAGCTVIEYEGAEISIKGGGGPTCLTRPIYRAV